MTCLFSFVDIVYGCDISFDCSMLYELVIYEERTLIKLKSEEIEKHTLI